MLGCNQRLLPFNNLLSFFDDTRHQLGAGWHIVDDALYHAGRPDTGLDITGFIDAGTTNTSSQMADVFKCGISLGGFDFVNFGRLVCLGFRPAGNRVGLPSSPVGGPAPGQPSLCLRPL